MHEHISEIHTDWLKALPMPAVLHDGGRVLFFNPAAEDLFGLETKVVGGLPLSTLVTAAGINGRPDRRPARDAGGHPGTQGGHPVLVTDRDGTKRPWDAVTTEVPGRNTERLMLTVLKPSPDEELLDLLDQALREKQAAFENMPVPAVELTCALARTGARETNQDDAIDIQVTSVNTSAIAFFQGVSDEGLASHLADQFSAPEILIGLRAACTGTDPVRRSFGIEMASVRGNVLRFAMTVTRVTPPDVQPVQLVIYLEDTSQAEASALNQEAYRDQLRNLVRLRSSELSATQRLIANRTQLMERLLASRSPQIAAHMKRVAGLAERLACQLELDPFSVAEIVAAAEYHDVGILNIPCEILARTGPISAAEYALIQEHPQHSCDILSAGGYSESSLRMISEHHERSDGSGYPLGLIEPDICLGARILAVADAVDAMTALRPHRPALELPDALATLSQASSQFDTQVIDACIEVFARGFELSERPPESGYLAFAEVLAHSGEAK